MDAYCGIPTPTLVYAGPSSREDFDRLELPATVHDWKPDATTTLIKADGKQWERRCTSKTLGDMGSNSVTVVFQWWDHRIAPAVAQPAQASA
ncbi:hypothetical protein [Xanthomonas theicola]|uniref:Uncharacterized protein n=1 Tax=Xanthomonas theicola TaxID=56464 RepID=A0A2S6ZMA2_9XANT|nr:hypothetical protein [Xanthomonas theicola]PPT93240.1 hypothetical protein XthCFBP4691_01110 [Xanthomonas theicola]QNH24825.1 hypothetical protein G4Q83_08790 [Xanthomonas theicola]